MKKIIRIIIYIAMIFLFTSISFAETNLSNAKNINIGDIVTGEITEADSENVYQFTLSDSGKLNIDYMAEMRNSSISIYDESGQNIWSERNLLWDSTTKQISFNEDINLTSGTYYFVISKLYDDGIYRFKLSTLENSMTKPDNQDTSDDSSNNSNDNSDNMDDWNDNVSNESDDTDINNNLKDESDNNNNWNTDNDFSDDLNNNDNEPAVSSMFIIGQPFYSINGEIRRMDVSPIIKNNRTMLPFRYIAGACGIDEKSSVSWNGNTETAAISGYGKVVMVTKGNKVMTVIENGLPRYVVMDTAAVIEKNRIYVPFRAVAEEFGFSVEWYSDSRTVVIY